jgi:hypothetical protein
MVQTAGHWPRRYAGVGALAVAVVLPWLVRANAAWGDGPTTKGVLVLRNGNVLSGDVRRIGDVYRIESRGGTLQVPAGQVERFAPSLWTAYEARRRDRVEGSADAHVDIARWCLQVGLHDLAARELLDARTLEPGHGGAALVELQLRQAIEASTQRVPSSRVTVVAANASAANAAVGADVAVENAGATTAELSADARIQFVRSIQPMLIQSCATSGCHQPGSAQTLQLDRWALVGKGNAEIVRRNLAAVRREVDIDDPMASRLLQMARSPHGGGSSSESRPITARQAALLVDWLNAVAGVQPTTHESDAGASGANGTDFGVEQAVYDVPMLEPPAEPGLLPAPPAARFQPRDAFDPEIFNRRFAKESAEFDPEIDEGAVTEVELEPLDPPAQPEPSPSADP